MMVQELGSLPFKFKCVQHGLKHVSQAIYEEVVKVGKQQGQDLVALLEGIQGKPGGLRPGGMPVAGGEGHDYSKSVTRSARLPIPEGRLDRGPIKSGNGQSESGYG